MIALAGNGLWYDALAVLGNARLQEPDNEQLSETWVELMQDIELEHIAPKPLVDCCQLGQ